MGKRVYAIWKSSDNLEVRDTKVLVGYYYGLWEEANEIARQMSQKDEVHNYRAEQLWEITNKNFTSVIKLMGVLKDE